MFSIESDFIDYYDSSNNGKGYRYRRFYSEQCSKAKALEKLRKRNIKTLSVKQVSNFYEDADKVDKLVVYTEPTMHRGKGKVIESLSKARMMYSNYPASRYYEKEAKNIIKYLQIGERSFQLYYETDGSVDSKEKAKYIVENGRGFNEEFKIPIFSIDYIVVKDSMIAIDFNEIQELRGTGIEDVMTPEEVVKEVDKALTKFNWMIPEEKER